MVSIIYRLKSHPHPYSKSHSSAHQATSLSIIPNTPRHTRLPKPNPRRWVPSPLDRRPRPRREPYPRIGRPHPLRARRRGRHRPGLRRRDGLARPGAEGGLFFFLLLLLWLHLRLRLGNRGGGLRWRRILGWGLGLELLRWRGLRRKLRLNGRRLELLSLCGRGRLIRWDGRRGGVRLRGGVMRRSGGRVHRRPGDAQRRERGEVDFAVAS